MPPISSIFRSFLVLAAAVGTTAMVYDRPVAIAGSLTTATAESEYTFTKVPGLTDSSTFRQSRFYDLRNSGSQSCIEALAARKIINGFPDGSFRPHFPVTRAQFAAMTSRAFANAQPLRSAQPFRDVSPYDWYASAVQSAYQAGFMSGFPGQRFQPKWGITRAQVLVALASGLNYTPSRSALVGLRATYRDADKIPAYAWPAIAAAKEQQWLASGSSASLLRPNQLARREEVAIFLCQALRESSSTLVNYPEASQTR